MVYEDIQIAVVGAGNMGGALMAGWVRSGGLSPQQITAVDVLPDVLARHQKSLGVKISGELAPVLADQHVVFIGVKPQYWMSTIADFKHHLRPDQLVVSFMAGVNLKALESELPGIPLIRMMPNILAQIGACGSGVCLGPPAGSSHSDLLFHLLNLVGTSVLVSEAQMDAVTGLAGSGPAYVYTMIDALADGGVRMGLPKVDALKLAVQTVMGAAQMVKESGEHPAVLKDRVTS
ncbi:MAG: pyrroline-5-carboxylate reductase, partial [bacterium]|nr:pyrroline-5-carboxylate reductase [bacterium]